MGNYLNPGNSGFEEIRRGMYIDKTGLAATINRTIGTTRKLSCISRPRRFGKSFAAQMLCAYYDRTVDSHALFDGLAVSHDPSYEEHLNRYDVICLDMTAAKPSSDGFRNLVPFVTDRIGEELAEAYSGLKQGGSLAETLANAVDLSGRRFVVVVDEWDAPIREAPQFERTYLEFLRSLFKNTQVTAKTFAAVFMCGILPIRKDGSQSAVSDFREYTMLDPGEFAPYVGFTEAEVRSLCDEHGRDFAQMKQWYDGYQLEGVGSVYNPSSVMRAAETGKYRSYWTASSATNSLPEYISLDFDGLSDASTRLLAGIDVPVNTRRFANDLVTFNSRDDVLTLLIHLGYLSYDVDTETARIPNEEIRIEYGDAIHEVKTDETIARVAASVKLIDDTAARDADAVAAQIERVHEEECAPLFYNSEQSLRSVVKLAYFAYKDHYLKFEELPGGSGYADIVYLPKKNSPYPSLVIELKWDDSAEGAIEQIRRRRYPQSLSGYGGEILLVGISYDRSASPGRRRHTCVIEAMDA